MGGGFFGMYLAEYFSRKGHHVILSEKENSFMKRASYVNQARIHNGYHYPRSILTALRSRVSFPRFYQEFEDCIDCSFNKYYMISTLLSKISAHQFVKFCQRISAVCEPAPPQITNLVNPNLIEAVFTTKEFAFDSIKLRNKMLERIQNANVDYFLNQKIKKVSKNNNKFLVHAESTTIKPESVYYEVDQVFNCTYSMINQLINESGLPLIHLKHELTEMALVEVPDVLKNAGITVMDGPFFSVMPFPSKGLHSFSHVRYTPHYEWYDTHKVDFRDAHSHYSKITKKSAWNHMIHDAQRYLPILSECKYTESLWEVKTILPRSESDDSRPILFKPNHGFPGFHSIMGGKIDNVYDVLDVIEKTRLIDG